MRTEGIHKEHFKGSPWFIGVIAGFFIMVTGYNLASSLPVFGNVIFVLGAWISFISMVVFLRIGLLANARRVQKKRRAKLSLSARIKGFAAMTVFMVFTGVFATFPAGTIQALFTAIKVSELFRRSVAAPLFEEALKPAGVVIVASVAAIVAKRRLRSKRIGVFYGAYGALAGFGFGMAENLISYPLKLFAFRSVTTLPFHMLLSSLVSLGIYSKFVNGRKGTLTLVLCYIVAVVAHGVWNYF